MYYLEKKKIQNKEYAKQAYIERTFSCAQIADFIRQVEKESGESFETLVFEIQEDGEPLIIDSNLYGYRIEHKLTKNDIFVFGTLE